MNYSVDCSEIIAQVQYLCTLECRQPTGDEYNLIITHLQKVNVHLQQFNLELQQENARLLQSNETVNSQYTNLLKDRVTNHNILRKKAFEVEEQARTIREQDGRIAKLTETLSGLQQEASESAKDLDDILKSNDDLTQQVSKLECALNKKNSEIDALLTEHNLSARMSKENEKTIASLLKDLEHCQCKLRSDREVLREPALTSLSMDSFTSPNLPQSTSHLAVAETAIDKYSFSDGKQRPNNGVYKRKTASAHSLSNVNPQQLRSSKIGMHDHSELRINDDSGLDKCNHFDEEQQAMMGKTLHTTAKAQLHCKMKTGRLHCNSTDLFICLKCGVTCCREHLYESHSKEHTIFMRMKNQKTWCFVCNCDPFPSNSTTSLSKKKSSKTCDKSRARKQRSNDREEIYRKSSHHYRNSGPKSASWSSSEAAEVASVWQSPPHNSPLFVPTSTGSATCTASYSATGKAFSDRQALNSPSNISSAAITSSNNLSTSYTSSPGIAQDLMNSSDVPANSNAPICIGRSNISTVKCDSLPVITMPVVTKIDAPPTVVMEPHIGGKQTNDTVASDSKLSGKSNLKSEILKAPIKPTIKSTGTTPTTAIVPVAHSSHRNTSYTNNWKNLTIPPNSKSKMNTSTNSTQCVSSSASETESLKHTSRPSHKRSSSFDTRNRTATKSGTSSVNENENSLPADTNTPSVDSLRRRSWSLDSQILYDLPPFKGLINTGLTCFFNAAVQGLSRIKQFNGLLTKLWKQSDRVLMDLKKLEYNIEVIIPETKHGEVSRLLSKAIDNIRKPPVTKYEAYFDPSFLFSSIQAKYRNSFRQHRQGDAHELMRCILDAVRMEEIEKVKRGIKQKYTGSENGDAESLLNGENKMYCKAALRGAHKLRTYIDQVIGGELLSAVVCEGCKYEAELIEPFLDISLPIPEKNTVTDCTTSCSMTQNPTLEECFEEYTSVDILDNDNKFICSSCSGEGDEIQLRKAKKQLQLQTLPKVFIIHLKRFSIDHIVTKNSTHVKYSSNIDVKPYCAKSIDEKQSTQYSLFAVVQHIGSLNFGHYTAYVKMEDTGLWYKADDSLISEVQEREALRQEAYLLFYQQRS